MSTNFPHVLGGSLPNDYAIVSHFASHDSAIETDTDADDTIDEGDEGANAVSTSPVRRSNRRLSGYGGAATSQSPSSRRRHLSIPDSRDMIGTAGVRKTSFGGHSHRSPRWNAPEREPLLAAVPRMVEDDDTISDETETWHTWVQELKIISRYTAPVFGTHVLEYSLSMASVISIGHLSTNHLAAVTLGSMTSSVTGLSVLLGFVSALDSLLPQAWTSNPKLVGLWSQRMAFLMLLLLIPIFMVWFSAEPILLGLKQEPEVAHLASLYLRWLSLGLPAYAFNAVSRRYFQSIGLMHIPTTIVILVAPINVFLNWLLVWGPPPVRLGYIGAPISTAISFNLITVCTVTYGLIWAPRDAWHPIGAASFKSLGLLVQLGLAGVGQLASEWWSWELVGLAASLLGPVSLAAQSVLLVSASTSYQAPYALSVAASVRIGNSLGASNAMRAKVATSVALLMSLIISTVFSTLFLTFRNKWAYIFNDDIQVVRLVAAILPLVAVFQIFDGLCGVTGGVLRCRGRQSLGALLNFISYYIIGIPLGLVLTFRFDMQLYGLWIGLAAALLFASAVTVTFVLRTDWEHEIERVQRRLAGDREREIPTKGTSAVGNVV